MDFGGYWESCKVGELQEASTGLFEGIDVVVAVRCWIKLQDI